ncbi:MAG: recombinase family protein, partial [Roseburia sp.]|nr:recombinase family protein [Roseburia sp.]
ARDTSAKIRAVKRSTFKAGKYIGAYAPFGYQKSPEDKHILVPDPATAPIVKRIFDLRCQGFGYRKIAAVLNGDKILTPRDYYYLQAGNPNPRGETPFWNDITVKVILQNEVYLGHTVQNKTGNVSYKIHKQVSKPRTEWIRVEGTHEPLISQEVWDLVRSIEQNQRRNRTAKDGTVHLFSGILVCMDCGSVMRHQGNYHKCKDGSPVKSTYESYLCNRYCSSGKGTCTAHTMNQRVLIEVVLADIRMKAEWARNDPAALVAQIQTQRRAASAEQMKQTRLTLTAIEKRLAELGKLVQAIYEDKVMGRIPETVCIQLMNQYEAERAEKLEQKARLSSELETYQQETDDVQQWMSIIREYTKLEELDRPTLLRLIKKIEVGDKKVEDGRTFRDIRIHYNFVGYIEA